LNLARGKTHPRGIEYLVWLGGFVSAALVLVWLGRIALRLLQEAERNAAAEVAKNALLKIDRLAQKDAA
jgi:hypothetical protein